MAAAQPGGNGSPGPSRAHAQAWKASMKIAAVQEARASYAGVQLSALLEGDTQYHRYRKWAFTRALVARVEAIASPGVPVPDSFRDPVSGIMCHALRQESRVWRAGAFLTSPRRPALVSFKPGVTLLKTRLTMKRDLLPALQAALEDGVLVVPQPESTSGPVYFRVKAQGADGQWRRLLLGGTSYIRTGGWPSGTTADAVSKIFGAHGLVVRDARPMLSQMGDLVVDGQFELSVECKEPPPSSIILHDEERPHHVLGRAWVQLCSRPHPPTPRAPEPQGFVARPARAAAAATAAAPASSAAAPAEGPSAPPAPLQQQEVRPKGVPPLPARPPKKGGRAVLEVTTAVPPPPPAPQPKPQRAPPPKLKLKPQPGQPGAPHKAKANVAAPKLFPSVTLPTTFVFGGSSRWQQQPWVGMGAGTSTVPQQQAGSGSLGSEEMDMSDEG